MQPPLPSNDGLGVTAQNVIFFLERELRKRRDAMFTWIPRRVTRGASLRFIHAVLSNQMRSDPMFDMSGGRRQAGPGGERPLDGGLDLTLGTVHRGV